MVVNSERFRQRFAQVLSSGWRGCLLAVLMGLLIGILVVSPRSKLPILGLTAGVTGLFFWLYQPVRISVYRVEKICCYLTFITGFFGVALFPIDIGQFTLFPYRIFLSLLWSLFVARLLIQGHLVVPLGGVKLYMAFFGIWLSYAVVSLGWAAYKVGAIRHTIFLFMGASLIFFAVYYFQSDRDLQNLYWVWLTAFFSLLLLGFWEHLTGQHLPVSGYNEERLSALAYHVRADVMYRPTGVFKNPNDYATFLSFCIPFALGTARYAGSSLARLAGIGSAFAAFYLIVVTGSRANILAVLLVVAFLCLFLTNSKQKAKVAFALAVCVTMAIIVFPVYLKEFFSKVITQLGSIVVKAGLEKGSVAVRANLVRNGLTFLYSTAGFGVGAGNAEYWMANFAQHETGGILNPHNWWLEILINYGIFVFVGYVAVYISIVWRLWRSWHEVVDHKEYMIVESLLLSLIGFSVASLSSSSIMAFNPEWMLFAFALAFLNRKKSNMGWI